MDQALDILPGDYWRWYLTANAPEGSDAAFTWEHFQGLINSDLANVLGNFVNRITKYTASKFDGQVPAAGTPGEDEAWMAAELETRLPAIIANMEAMEFRKAASDVRAVWAAGNEYLTKAEPWVKYKSDVDAAAVGVRTGLNLVALFGILAQPFIPEAAKKILDAVGVPEDRRSWNFDGPASELLDALPHGLAITPPEVLFAKIEDAQLEEWSNRFGGAPSE